MNKKWYLDKLKKILSKRKLKKLYHTNKLSTTEIGKLYNVQRHTIIYLMKYYHISFRSCSERTSLVVQGEKNPNFGNKWSDKQKEVARKRSNEWYSKEDNIEFFRKICEEKVWYNEERNKKLSKWAKTKTGKKNPRYKVPHTKETRELIGKKSKAKWTPEYKEKIRKKCTGNKKRDVAGYILVRNYEHPNRNKHNEILEHRLVMAKKLKRPLKKEEIVHHIDGNRTNNKISNLYLCKNLGEHAKIHLSFRYLIFILLQRKIIKFKKGKYIINDK